jgi:hypothetical protein
MTVSFLSLPFEAVSAITTYVPEEDFLLTSSVSKIWRTACSEAVLKNSSDPRRLKLCNFFS